MIGDGRYRLAPIPAAEVIRCICNALDSPGLAGRAYTLAGEEIAFSDLVDAMASRLGVTRLKAHIPVAAARAVTRAGGLLGIGPAPDQVDRLLMEKPADSSRARKDLSFSPPTIDDLLESVFGGAAGAGEAVG
jgi:nucleoside-diphosphate-sugar epimerase